MLHIACQLKSRHEPTRDRKFGRRLKQILRYVPGQYGWNHAKSGERDCGENISASETFPSYRLDVSDSHLHPSSPTAYSYSFSILRPHFYSIHLIKLTYGGSVYKPHFSSICLSAGLHSLNMGQPYIISC